MVKDEGCFVDKEIQPRFYHHGANLCFDCENYCGKCSWTETDPATGKTKFQPVEGWVTRKLSRRENRKWIVVEQIVECPLFIPTPDKEGV
jgi:hypothetical protein